MKYKHRILNNNGFTLLEIMVALAVSSVIMLMIYTAHRSILFSITDMSGIAEFYENVNLTLRRIDHDLSCVYYVKESEKINFSGSNEFGVLSKGKVTFVTIDGNDFYMRGDPTKEYRSTDIKEVSYFIKEDPLYPGIFFLMRREQNLYGKEYAAGSNTSVVLENVTDIKFEFAAQVTFDNKWESKDNKRYPRAVKTTLKVKNYRGIEETFELITILNMVTTQ